MTRRRVLTALGAFGVYVAQGAGQQIPQAVISLAKGLTGPSTGPATVVSSCASAVIVATSTAVNAAPTVRPERVRIFSVHPDDERAGP